MGEAGSGKKELLSIEALSVRDRAVRVIGGKVSVVQVIEDLGLSLVKTAQGKSARAAAQGETGVPFICRGKRRQSVGKDHFEFAGQEGSPGRKSPVGQVAVIGAEIETGE